MKTFIKYATLAILSQLFLLINSYFLIEIIGIKESIAYIISTSLIYAVVYILNINFVFNVNHNNIRLIKYGIYLIIVWFLSNISFNLLISIFKINYIQAIIFNIILFSLLKFLFQKKFIFNKKNSTKHL